MTKCWKPPSAAFKIDRARGFYMHELSVCQALIDQVEAIAQQHHAERVEVIVLQIGPLAGVEPQLLEHAYPLASVDTVAEDAKLIIEELPVVVRCQACGKESSATPNRLVCGACGDWHTRLLSGDEMLLARIELIERRE